MKTAATLKIRSLHGPRPVLGGAILGLLIGATHGLYRATQIDTNAPLVEAARGWFVGLFTMIALVCIFGRISDAPSGTPVLGHFASWSKTLQRILIAVPLTFVILLIYFSNLGPHPHPDVIGPISVACVAAAIVASVLITNVLGAVYGLKPRMAGQRDEWRAARANFFTSIRRKPARPKNELDEFCRKPTRVSKSRNRKPNSTPRISAISTISQRNSRPKMRPPRARNADRPKRPTGPRRPTTSTQTAVSSHRASSSMATTYHRSSDAPRRLHGTRTPLICTSCKTEILTTDSWLFLNAPTQDPKKKRAEERWHESRYLAERRPLPLAPRKRGKEGPAGDGLISLSLWLNELAGNISEKPIAEELKRIASFKRIDSWMISGPTDADRDIVRKNFVRALRDLIDSWNQVATIGADLAPIDWTTVHRVVNIQSYLTEAIQRGINDASRLVRGLTEELRWPEWSEEADPNSEATITASQSND